MAVSLTLRRNRYLIPLCIVVLLVLIYFGDKRVISVNIWDKWEVTTDYYDIENTIDLFDTTQVHQISINMTEEEYRDMIDTYSNTSEKDWYKTDITIDWVTVYNVGVRLKGNSSLRWMGWNNQWWPWWSVSWIDRWKWKHRDENGWDNRMMWFHWNRFGSWNMPWGMWWFPWDFGSWWMQRPEIFEWGSFWPGAMSGWTINYDTQLPLFVKFNKYEDQTYQGHEMISLRVGGMGNDTTLLAEPYSYELYQEAWQPAPDTSYWAVKIDGLDVKLFIISELPEDSYYISKWFGDDNGVLYKAGNFVDFEYQWDDPTEYSDYFTQKTRVNDYDMSLLIKLLKFVSTASDEEFSKWINNYINVESVLFVLAIDDFVSNQDSFWWMGSNYYLYYHLWEQKFYLLTWDQNLALWGMWWPGGWMWWMWNGSWWIMGWMWWIPGMWWESINTWDMKFMGEVSWDVSWFLWDFWWWNFSWAMMGWDFNPNNMPSDFNPWNFNPWEIPWNMPWGMWWFPWGENGTWGMGWKWGFWMNGTNMLKTRLLADKVFKAMYDSIYEQVQEIALNTEFTESFFSTWTNALLNYNEDNELIEKDTYLKAVETIKSKIEDKREN
jgi:spore coat protein CotH